MYQYLNALYKRKGQNEKWEIGNLSQVTMHDIFEKYADVYVLIQRTGQAARVVKQLTLQTTEVKVTPSQTLEMWLLSFPAFLQLSSAGTELPTIAETVVKYSDAWRAGFKANRIATEAYNIETVQPVAMMRDLLLSRFGTDYDVIRDNCLITVNGLLHKTSVVPGWGMRVYDGGISADIADANMLGIMSFREVGEIQTVSIVPDMIDNPRLDMPLYKTAYINLDMDLTGKQIALSLGGYLHLNEDCYQVVGAETGLIKIEFSKINLIDRLIESQDIIDLTSLELIRHPEHLKAIKVSDLMQPDVLLAYLCLPQTFVIVIDTPDVIYTDTVAIEPSGLPGRYQEHSEPIYPIRQTTGLFEEYHTRNEEGIWTIAVKSGLRPRYQFTNHAWINSQWVSPNLMPAQPHDVSLAQYYRIHKQHLSY